MGADTAGKPSRSRQTYEQFKTPKGEKQLYNVKRRLKKAPQRR